MPTTLRPLLLALLLIAAPGYAETLYQVELIVFRQAPPVDASQPVPEDWAGAAPAIAAEAQRSPALEDTARQLNETLGYPVLLRQAWQQAADDPPRAVRFAAGTPCDRHAPVEGLLSLRQERHLELELHTWVNRCDADGFLVASERLQHKRRLIPGQLTYLDHPSLGALIRVRPR